MKMNVAYGTLDLRIKQGLDVAEEQIKQLAANNPAEWYFDIIHTPNQTPLALHLLPEVQALLKRHSGKLPAAAYTVHLNTNEMQLRARSELHKKIYESEVKVNYEVPK